MAKQKNKSLFERIKSSFSKEEKASKAKSKKEAVKKVTKAKSKPKASLKKEASKKPKASQTSSKVASKAKPKKEVKKEVAKKVTQAKSKPKASLKKESSKKPKASAKGVKEVAKKQVKKESPAASVSTVKKGLKSKKGKSASLKSSPPRKTQELSAKQQSRLEAVRKELELILMKEKEEKLILKDMQGRNYCCIEDCGLPGDVEGFCRVHYLGFWDDIIQRGKILDHEVLTQAIEEILKNHGVEVLDFLIQDLKQEKNFTTAMKDVLGEDEEVDDEDLFLNKFFKEEKDAKTVSKKT